MKKGSEDMVARARMRIFPAVVLAVLLVLFSAVTAPAAGYMWVRVDADSGQWTRSGLTALEPFVRNGVTSWLLVMNDPGANYVTCAIPAGAVQVQVFSARYWQCGRMNIYIDGALRATVDLYYDNFGTGPEGVLMDQNVYSAALDGSTPHVLKIEAAGSGGPGIVNIGGVDYDLSWVHFANVQYIRYKVPR